jgi:tetratricopeptide (TPR) repeat protein
MKKTLLLSLITSFLIIDQLSAEVKQKPEIEVKSNFQVNMDRGFYGSFYNPYKKKVVLSPYEPFGASEEAVKNHKKVMKLLEESDLVAAKSTAFTFLSNLQKKDDIDYALALVDMGEVEKASGSYDLALKSHTKAFQLYDKLSSSSMITADQVLSCKYIANTFIMNDIDKQLIGQYIKQYSSYISRMKDENSKETGIYATLNAKYLSWTGKYDEADEQFNRAEKIFYADPGYQTITFLSVDIKRADQYLERNDFLDAVRYYKKGLANLEPLYIAKNPNHYALADIYNHLGTAYFGTGDYKSATESYRKSLFMYNSLVGVKNRTAAALYNNIGLTYSRLDKNNEAVNSFLKSITINKALIGTASHEVSVSHNNVAIVYLKLNKQTEALEHMKMAYLINKTLYGSQNDKTKIMALNVRNLEAMIKNNISSADPVPKTISVSTTGNVDVPATVPVNALKKIAEPEVMK